MVSWDGESEEAGNKGYFSIDWSEIDGRNFAVSVARPKEEYCPRRSYNSGGNRGGGYGGGNRGGGYGGGRDR